MNEISHLSALFVTVTLIFAVFYVGAAFFDVFIRPPGVDDVQRGQQNTARKRLREKLRRLR
jgi:hypothetical protein